MERSELEHGAAERNPARIIAFSDAVIAIAATLLVLEIRPPKDTSHLLHGLVTLWPSYATYVITFMLIGQVWANHHVIFDHIRHADRTLLFLNTMLLMDIAFLPFAASILAEAFRDGHGQRTAVIFHGIAFELAAVLFNIIWWHARRDRRLLANTIDCRRRESGQPPLRARSYLDQHRNVTGRRVPASRRGRNRRVHRLLLAAHPGRNRPSGDSETENQGGPDGTRGLGSRDS